MYGVLLGFRLPQISNNLQTDISTDKHNTESQSIEKSQNWLSGTNLLFHLILSSYKMQVRNFQKEENIFTTHNFEDKK